MVPVFFAATFFVAAFFAGVFLVAALRAEVFFPTVFFLVTINPELAGHVDGGAQGLGETARLRPSILRGRRPCGLVDTGPRPCLTRAATAAHRFHRRPVV